MGMEHQIRFGVFELDPAAGQLRKSGVSVPLSGQPLDVLLLLVRRPGEVVTREELKEALWPDETFVDFDNGVNSAIRRIRRALDDSPSSPRFLETLPKRGYRFIARSAGLAATWLRLNQTAARAPARPPPILRPPTLRTTACCRPCSPSP